MKISGSILAVHDNYMEYARQLKYANVDCLHIDIFQNSGEFKLNQLLDFDDKYLPLDVHLIFENITDKDIELLNSANISYINVQYENLFDKSSIPKLSKNIRANFGIAYTMETPIEKIMENLCFCSQVLFMCSEPGVSGAKFDERNFERIKEFRNLHPEVTVFVDGGIDAKRIEPMDKLGVNMSVSGSFLSRNLDQVELSSFALKYYDSKDAIADNKMLPLASLPIVSETDSFVSVVNIMNRHRLGVVFVLNGDEIKGIIADGDIRRGFIKYEREIFEKKANDLMNPDPYKVRTGTFIKDIYHDISSMHKGIEVIPVVDGGRMVGAVDLKLGK